MLYWFLHEQIICFYSWITWCITLIVLQLKYALSVHLIMTVVQLDGYASSCSPLPCLMSWNLEFCQIDQRWTAKSVCTLVMSVPVIIGNPIWSCYSRTPFLYGVVETGVAGGSTCHQWILVLDLYLHPNHQGIQLLSWNCVFWCAALLAKRNGEVVCAMCFLNLAQLLVIFVSKC